MEAQPRPVFKALVAVACLALVPALYNWARYLWALDPFAKYSSKWSDPFGGNIGSVMDNLDVTFYSGSSKTVSFHADKLEVRRDKQFIAVDGITRGTVYKSQKPEAEFSAAKAEYEARNTVVKVSGGATLKGKGFQVGADALTIDDTKKTITVPAATSGIYRNGKVKVASLRLNYGNSSAVATGIVWTGPSPVPGQENRDIQIRAKRFEGTSDPNVDVYFDAEAIDRDALMRAPKITYDKDADVIKMEGGCEYFGPDAIVRAPAVTVYRKEKRAVAAGDVHVTVKPEKEKGVVGIPPAEPVLPKGMQQPENRDIDNDLRSGKTVRKYPVSITCTKVEYWYAKGKKKAVMTGAPKARQELRAGSWREITAPTAIYEEEKELLTLISSAGGRDVRMKNSAGDDLMAETLVISTVEGKEKMSGTRIEGVMKVKEGEGGGGGSP
jgi:lipopolysaccharide export system protein LptA